MAARKIVNTPRMQTCRESFFALIFIERVLIIIKNSGDEFLASHWLPALYKQSLPHTPLRSGAQQSVNLGADMGPEAMRRLWLSNEYVQLLETPFDNGDLLAGFYQRPIDYKIRLFCRTVRPSHRRKDCCLPLLSLEVERDGHFLKFSRITSTGSTQLWACLKFANYEKLVLFFCSFLALRSADSNQCPTPIRDYSPLHNEEYLFGGTIIEDNFRRGLRMFKDKISGGVRLEASRMSKEARTPIWTAFITHMLLSPTWITRLASDVIQLGDLQRFIFSSDYHHRTTPKSELELEFVKIDDVNDFTKAIDNLRDSY